MKKQTRFDYDATTDFDIRMVSARPEEGIVVENFTYRSPFDRRRAAYLVKPEGEFVAAPPILFVHWYEPDAIDSNRNQFLAEAKQLAQKGAVCLCIETMWSDIDFFIKRTQADDEQNSIEQVIELRQALDLLLTQRGVAKEKLTYVGHDFGAMYGVLLGAIDARPNYYVLMAGTSRFPDWYLYYPAMEEADRATFIKSMTEYDPITNISDLSPAPVYFQFGDHDPHVPLERAEAFFEAAVDPKKIKIYQAGHGLNAEAQQDRLAWLTQQLGLKE